MCTAKLFLVVTLTIAIKTLAKIQPVSDPYDISTIFPIYDLYFDKIEYYRIIRILCDDEHVESIKSVDLFADRFMKAFSDLKKIVKRSKTLCQMPDISYWNWTVLEAPTRPKPNRTENEIIMERLLVSNLRIGTVLIINSSKNIPQEGYFNIYTTLDLRSIYLLIFVEVDPNEVAILRILWRFWNVFNCLNVVAHAPYSENKDFIYVYDPFYRRLVYPNFLKGELYP